MEPREKTRIWDAFLVLSVIWGSSFLFMKVAGRMLAPAYVTLGRTTIGALTLVVILLIKRIGLPRGRTVWFHLAVASILLNVAPYTLFAWAEQTVPSLVAGIFNAAAAILTVLVAYLILPDEQPNRRRVLGVPIGFVGVTVVLGIWRTTGGVSLIGQLACLLAAACYAIGLPYSKRYIIGRSESTLSLAAGQLLIGSVLTGILALAVSGLPHVAPGHWQPAPIMSVLALGAFGTGIAFLLNYRIVRRVGATATVLVTYVMPIVAAVEGVLLLHERLTWNQPVGALVIFAGMAITQDLRLPKRSAATQPVPELPIPKQLVPAQSTVERSGSL